MCVYIYIYVFNIIYVLFTCNCNVISHDANTMSALHQQTRYHIHLVSITRFPPGAGLLRNPFVHRQWRSIFQGLGPKRRESSKGDRVYVHDHVACAAARRNCVSPASIRLLVSCCLVYSCCSRCCVCLLKVCVCLSKVCVCLLV